MKKYSFGFMAISLFFILASCVNESSEQIGLKSNYAFPENGVITAAANIPAFNNKGYKQLELNTAYLEGYDSVPFITLSDFKKLLAYVSLDNPDFNGFSETMNADKTVITVTRTDRNLSMSFDFANQIISSNDYTAFVVHADMYNKEEKCAVLSTPIKDFVKVESITKEEHGHLTRFNIGDYGLKMYMIDNKLYIPMQIASTLLTSPNFYVWSFNGKNYYLFEVERNNSFQEDSYLANYGRTGGRTRAEAEFNYRMLSMLFDGFYGLKHLRSSDMSDGFNTFAFRNNLEQRLLSSDPYTYDMALLEILMKHVDDGHTSYKYPSFYERASDVETFQRLADSNAGNRERDLIRTANKFDEARRDAGKEIGLRFFTDSSTGKEIAVMTFDDFLVKNYGKSYDSSDIERESAEYWAETDTFAFFYKAFKVIDDKNSGSPNTVENVIIDISNNGGGAIDACLQAAAFLIHQPQFPVRNCTDGSFLKIVYSVDTNLDGVFDSADARSLDNMHYYILTSGFSFSCGNCFPSMMQTQTDEKVKIIGQKSGGGGAAVLPAGTGDGAVFKTSSQFEMVTTDGESIDNGVPVDLQLDISVFYDDEELLNAIKEEYPSNF